MKSGAHAGGRRSTGAVAARSAPERAVALAGQIGGAMLDRSVLDWIHAERRRPVGVAVSGGLDSVCCLFLLWAHFPKLRPRLRVLHFDHALRGRASAADARWVEKLSADLGVVFLSGRWERPRGLQVDEADARVARLDFFSAASRDWGFRGIALGHHADDAAETFLQRAVRGGGSEALVAPDAVQKLEGRGIVLLRPLINLRRNALEGAARQAGVVWREDATNAGDAHERNRIRRHVLPALSQASGRDAAGGIIAARARLLEEAEVVAWAWERFKGGEAGHWHSRNHLQVSALLDLPRLFRERVLREWLVSKSRGVLPSRAWLAGPLAALERREDSGTWTLAAGLRLKLAGDRLILGP